jgi:hypothetical protein
LNPSTSNAESSRFLDGSSEATLADEPERLSQALCAVPADTSQANAVSEPGLLDELRALLADAERDGIDEGAVRAALAMLRGTGGR